MRQAAIALRSLLASVVGLEGAFLIAGTALLAVGAGYLDAAGPWFVVGGVLFLTGIALVIPRRAE